MWLFNEKYTDMQMLIWGAYIMEFPELVKEPAVNMSLPDGFVDKLTQGDWR